jgi:Zn-dependent peptidase ImmA (M78 family)
VFDKKTIYTIRKARSLQEIGSELSFNIDYSIKPAVKRITIAERAENLAVMYREHLRLDEEVQRKFRTSYELFNYLRDGFEDMNILVFQFSMPVEDARGFALTDKTPNVIVVNSKDSIEARIFSLMHEFGHVLLGETVIDLPDISRRFRDEIELWCNEFASGFLMPKEIAIKIFKSEERVLTDTKTLNALSRRYKVSKAMLLYNMLKLDFITREEYEGTLGRYSPKEVEGKKEGEEAEKKKGGRPTADVRCLSEVGNKFVSIVANNYDRDYITYTDALNYLSIKSKNFDKVLAQARK